MKEKKILFICSVYPPELESIYFPEEVAGFQAAAVAWQWNLINGFEKNIGRSIQILSGILIPQFSLSYRKVFCRGYEWQHSEGADDCCILFLNIFPIKNIFREINIKKRLRRWLRENRDGENYVIVYSPHVPFIKALEVAKKCGALTCAVIPDLPEFAGASRMDEPLYRMLKGHDVKSFYKASAYIDRFVFLTDEMKERFAPDIKYTVVEGMCDPVMANYKPSVVCNYKTVLYSGSVMRDYGIMQLVEAFKYINDPTIRLVICGDGDARADIVQAARKDNRISYLGSLKRERVIELQRSATILVNPRGAEDEFTKYSFPSKIIEYMLAAKPVVCCKLGGIPYEYDDYLLYIQNNKPQTIAEKLRQLCLMSKDELETVGERTRNFVVAQKNIQYQCLKIIDLIGF